MKKSIVNYSILLAVMLLATISVNAQDKPKTKVLLVPEGDSTQVVAFTLDAIGVIDGKCLGCHSPSGRSDDAKEALIWQDLQNATGTDAYAIMDEVMEVLEEGSMPPEKMVEKYPGLKLTDEETAILKAWAESVLAKLEE